MRDGARPHLVLVDEPFVLPDGAASRADVEAFARHVDAMVEQWRATAALIGPTFDRLARDCAVAVERLAALVPEEGPVEVEAPMLRALAAKRARSAPPSVARLDGRRR